MRDTPVIACRQNEWWSSGEIRHIRFTMSSVLSHSCRAPRRRLLLYAVGVSYVLEYMYVDTWAKKKDSVGSINLITASQSSLMSISSTISYTSSA